MILPTTNEDSRCWVSSSNGESLDMILPTTDDTSHQEWYFPLSTEKIFATPSIDVVKILKKCDAYFRVYVSGCTDDLQISAVKNIKGILANKILRELFSASIFSSMIDHDFANCLVTEDLHSTQLTKKIVDYYLRIRLFRYGQQYSSAKLKKSKHGLRQHLTKSILFQGLWVLWHYSDMKFNTYYRLIWAF